MLDPLDLEDSHLVQAQVGIVFMDGAISRQQAETCSTTSECVSRGSNDDVDIDSHSACNILILIL